MATASPSQAFWADGAPVVLTALYSADEAKTVLGLWQKYQTNEIQQALLEAQAAGRDGPEAVLQVEDRLQSEFTRKMAAAQARIPENSETQQTVLSVADGSPEDTSAQSLSQEGARILEEYQLDCNPDIKAQAIRAFRALFPEASTAVDPTYTEMRRALTTRIEALLDAKVISTVSYKTYLSGMPHPTRDDGLNRRQLLQWEWAFNPSYCHLVGHPDGHAWATNWRRVHGGQPTGVLFRWSGVFLRSFGVEQCSHWSDRCWSHRPYGYGG